MTRYYYDGSLIHAFDSATKKIHVIHRAADGTETDLGALATDLTGATVTADVVDVDIAAITGNPAKSLADLYTPINTVAGAVNASAVKVKPDSGAAFAVTNDDLASLLNSQDYVVTAVYTATIGASSTVPTAFNCTLPAGLVRLAIVPRGDVYWNIGEAASANTAKLMANTIQSLPFTRTVADGIRVYASSVVCDLLVIEKRV